MQRVSWIFLLLFNLCFLSTTNAASLIKDLSITHLADPIPAPTSDKQLLAYELQFVNSGDEPKRVSRIEIWEQKKLLASFSGDALIQQSTVYHPKTGPVKEKIKTIELQKDMGAFIFLSVTMDKNKTAPSKLENRIWITTAKDGNSYANAEVLSYPITVSTDKPVMLGPPLHGNGWIAEAAFSPTSYHRRAVLPFDGGFYLAQRYAIDFERMCDDGLEVHGNMHENGNWQAYGYELLAVADGVVSKISERTVADNTPPGFPNPPPAVEDATGNYVILQVMQHNKNYYVLYAHMQPNSIKVKVGQKVKKGDVIGILGNSGNSSAPHLHLHVTDTNEGEKSNGVPFMFDSATVQGTAKEVDQDYGIWVKPTWQQTRFKRMMPTENQVFYFDKINRSCPGES